MTDLKAASSSKILALELGTLVAYWLASDYLSPRDVALLTLALCVGSAIMTLRAGGSLDGFWIFGNATALVMSFQTWLRPDWPGGAMNDVLIGGMLLWYGARIRTMVAGIADAQRRQGVFMDERRTVRMFRPLALVWGGYFVILAMVDLVVRAHMKHAMAETWNEWIFGVSVVILGAASILGLRRLAARP